MFLTFDNEMSLGISLLRYFSKTGNSGIIQPKMQEEKGKYLRNLIIGGMEGELIS